MEKTQAYFFFGLLALVALISFFIVLPYLPAIVFAAALAVVFRPVHDRFTAMFKSERLSAWLTLVFVLVIVLIPLVFVGFEVITEAKSVYADISQKGLTGFSVGPLLQQTLSRISPSLADNSEEILKNAMSWTVSSAGAIFSGTVTVLINIFIAFMALYYFLVGGKKLNAWILRFSPLPDKYDSMIMARLTRTVASVIRGTLVIAIIQGTLAGIGYRFFGVPNPSLWGSITAISALIPGVGTSLVLIPSIIYLFLAGKTVGAFGLLAWAVIAVGLIDNFLGPRLVNRGARIPEFAIFIAVIGGLALFGPLGFLMGPLVMSLLFTLLDIYGSIQSIEKGKPVAD